MSARSQNFQASTVEKCDDPAALKIELNSTPCKTLAKACLHFLNACGSRLPYGQFF